MQMMGHQLPVQKARNGRKGGAQEQLRFCKETIKELFKKTHESYAYPFYQPVGKPFILLRIFLLFEQSTAN
jgi:hypothetical protein